MHEFTQNSHGLSDDLPMNFTQNLPLTRREAAPLVAIPGIVPRVQHRRVDESQGTALQAREVMGLLNL